MRVMDEAEVQELAEYPNVPAAELRGPLKVYDAQCPACARRIAFLDFAKTAVGLGRHSKEGLRGAETADAPSAVRSAGTTFHVRG
ncbi:hypothetical protein HHL19_18375 [Streptomyces sp. R302]|uniref:hypothetical protein n=1 Tax=unclassified Streptomyces TaxID=2593676 RepID=UPI00145F78C3|nr:MULTISPECIES: hypothetical protein [unclassified Streptomyces]NML52483.1 hypothetical protein [Streptomyces sp. R301]NML80588.1 hypothetical protein [Streptomyces sp. R302]